MSTATRSPVTATGRGAVWLEAGYVVFAGPIFESPTLVRNGPDGFRSAEDHDAFCAYFER